MILTEDEAKTKWCPEVRTGLNAGMAVNYHIGQSRNDRHAGDVHEETSCVASGCMMWRWRGWRGANDTDPFIVSDPKDCSGAPQHYGFCGKAGRP